METLYPSPLQKGDTIGVIAPSSVYDVEKLKPAREYLESQGLNVIFHPQTSAKHHQFAGTADEKVSALHDYFSEPSIKAIFCTCGGNGAIHLLDKIDYKIIKKNPKIFMGFSDITLLLNAIYAQTGLVTFHGPTLSRMQKIDSACLDQMIETLAGKSDSIAIEGADMEGTLIGGNLSATQALIGTPYAPQCQNTILLMEDINDHYSRYDRMIAHMKQAGWIRSLSGIIVGDFLNSLDNPDRPFGFDIKAILDMNAPDSAKAHSIAFGHGKNLYTLPIGAKAVLKNNRLSFKAFA
jgi:muramoyltetrapeptide carboxypeptidase